MSKEIKTVSIIGLGALGVLFGEILSRKLYSNLRIIADKDRVERYEKEGLYSNGKELTFHYVLPEEKTSPADLVIFAVKYSGLKDAIRDMRNQIGKDTIILSALNGITSESIIGKTYGFDNILYCVAQGMDAVKEKNKLSYTSKGMLVFGDKLQGVISENRNIVADFFDKMEFPYQLDVNMEKRLWGKFMLNVGVNQTVAVYEGNYGIIKEEGIPREKMIAAMKEVMSISSYEGTHLTDVDLEYWLEVLSALNKDGKPSMAQDVDAKRITEVDLFSGTVIELGKKYNVPTPVNFEYYERIKKMESGFVKEKDFHTEASVQSMNASTQSLNLEDIV